MNIYDFTVKSNQGEAISLAQYKGKVLLIVNTATQCGLTPQYEKLEALYKKYQPQGLEVLDFPSNQFLAQAPGTDADIDSFCTLTYGTTFPRFAKLDVNGEHADPLFVFLKQQAPTDIGDETSAAFEARVRDIQPPKEASDIKWNFGKFLIGRDGSVAARYSPAYVPEKLASAIEKELAKK